MQQEVKRQGASSKTGRPKIAKGQETKTMGFKIDVKTKDKVHVAAHKMGIPASDIIRIAVQDWLTAFEKSGL